MSRSFAVWALARRRSRIRSLVDQRAGRALGSSARIFMGFEWTYARERLKSCSSCTAPIRSCEGVVSSTSRASEYRDKRRPERQAWRSLPSRSEDGRSDKKMLKIVCEINALGVSLAYAVSKSATKYQLSFLSKPKGQHCSTISRPKSFSAVVLVKRIFFTVQMYVIRTGSKFCLNTQGVDARCGLS